MKMNLQNSLLLLAVVALTLFPLVSIDASVPAAGGAQPEMFTGADDQAKAVIQEIAPDYQPWFSSIFTPGVEIEGLLFALQAALGAGIIGFYLGYSRGRAKTANQSADSTHVA